MQTRRSLRIVSAVTLTLAVGCTGGPSPLIAPSIDRAAGQNAVKQYDTDGDGALGEAELAKSPALKSVLTKLDADGDGKLSANEIDARIDAWRESQVALIPITVAVTLDGQRLPGAEVRFIPEPFLGDDLKPAAGTTSPRGMAAIWISDDLDDRGVAPGFYRVEITKSGSALPAKYNTATELGLEIAGDNANRDFNFDLKSK